ncbi:MAG TPA: dihydrolipoyl dehydrogenase [Vicinamibacterales bacterium]|jgi:dihydrolipoamide dehydrogenase|nr:dihydrolipoyl dehydrogenase [Vicinamibacterales bacterium]
MSISTQLVVVGAGPGGYAAAFYAADRGLQVTLVDPEKNPGGVCVYRGCIPSKALLHVAQVINESRHASDFGVQFQKPSVDLDKLRAFKDAVVEKLTSGAGQVRNLRKVRHLRGTAAFRDSRTIDVRLVDGANETVTFENCIIATGSRPTTIPGLSIDSPRVMDSTGALDLPDIPGSLLVVGGGYIGLELGTVYAALGSRVTVVEMTDGLLPGADRDLVGIVARRVESMCEAVLLKTKVTGIKEAGGQLSVSLDGVGFTGERTFDRVLMSIGRRPNSSIPGLDTTGVQVDKRGFIIVDERRRTADPAIYAIGDVAGEPMLAHKASHEGRAAVDAIAGDRNVAFEPLAIPAVVFTDPEIAWAGLTEAEAERQGRKVAIAKFPWGASGRAITLGRTDGLTKLLLDPASERILGVGICGVGAGEMIAEGVLAIEMGATAKDLAMTIHPHPTLTETLMEAAEVFFGTATHVFRPKRR